jgi:hypothetical protein
MSVTAYLARALSIRCLRHIHLHLSKPGLLVQGWLVGGSLSMTEVQGWVVQGKATKSEAACQRLSKSSRLGLEWLGD